VEEECDESLFWLEFIIGLELIDKKLLENLMKEANALVAIFTAAIKISKTNQKS
jgi:hypothetical protein